MRRRAEPAGPGDGEQSWRSPAVQEGGSGMRTENGENEREGVRSGLRHRIVEELNGRRETRDEELLEIIDRSIREMGNEI